MVKKRFVKLLPLMCLEAINLNKSQDYFNAYQSLKKGGKPGKK
jgi:hypothetical protein